MDYDDLPTYFGDWLKLRRKAIDLTQVELAGRAGCSVPALRKIESGERRPSKQLAALLAQSLEVPLEEQATFVRVARGELNLERLGFPARSSSAIPRPIPEPEKPRGSLPGMLTPFVGREPEITSLIQLLTNPQCRLVTVFGPGGVGKTRLAIEVANRHKGHFSDGAWFVPLAPLNSPEHIISAIADAMDFKFQDPTRPQGQLLNYLRDKKALLLMDNAEHLLGGVRLFAEILQSCQQVKLLVTSRERLNLLSEWLFEAQGLPVPGQEEVEHIEGYGSVALFLQTAQRTRAGFELHDDDRQWVVQICRIMEGMPLGIELAAAWVGVLSCEEIATEIERNIDFLTVSMRDLPERHRSLRATLDHSWNLLNSEEKAILSKLSIFRGSFSRIAAEEICGASLTALSSLKDKSLLRRTHQGWFDLHEFIRQYAATRLSEEDNQSERLKDQHALYYARCLSEWEKALQSSRQLETLTEMADEIDDLRQAWRRMVTCCDLDCKENTLFNSSIFHSSLFSLSLFYEMRCRNWEALSLFEESLECLKAARDTLPPDTTDWRFGTLVGHVTAYLGLHHAYTMQYRRAQELLEEAIELLETNQARVEGAQAKLMLGWVYQQQYQIQKASLLYQESLRLFREEGVVWWESLACYLLAGAYLTLSDAQESMSAYQEGLRLADAGDLRLRSPILMGIGRAHYLQGDYSLAASFLKESLDLSYQLGNMRSVAFGKLYLGQVSLAGGETERGEKYLRDCIKMLDEFGESPDLGVALLHLGKCLAASRQIAAARSTFQKLIEIGQTLGLFDLINIGLVHCAMLCNMEERENAALEMLLTLRQYPPMEVTEWQNESDRLLEDLENKFSKEQFEEVQDRVIGRSLESLLVLA